MEANKTKSGLFASLKPKAATSEEAKVVYSKKQEFGETGKQGYSEEVEKPRIDVKAKGEVEAVETRSRDEGSREMAAFSQARSVADERKAKAERARKEEEKMERERKAAEEKDRQRYNNPALLSSWVEERLLSYSKQLEEKNKKQLELIAEGNKLQEKLSNLYMRKAQSSEKQEKAAADEDYDEAERLNQVIKDMELVIVQTSTEIGKNATLYQSYESDKTEIYTSQMKFLQEVQGKVAERKSVEEADFARLKAAKAERKSAMELKLGNEEKRLREEVERLRTEGDKLEGEKEETEARIHTHTGEIQEEKTAAESELATVEAEIEELERQLQIKRIQRQSLVETIADKDAQILERLAAFQDELTMVEIRMKKLSQAEEKANKDQEALENAKNEFELECEEAMKEIEAAEQRVKMLAKCLEEQKLRQERLEKLGSARQQYLARIEEHSILLKLRQEQLREAEEYAKTVKESEEDVRHRFVQKSDRLSELEVKIPKLEAEKKAFAAAKQYKDAARLANEVKLAITERESLIEEIEKVRATMTEQDQQSSEVLFP